MGSIVVGFVDSAEGDAALSAGIHEAARRGERLIVVHSLRGGARTDDDEYLKAREALARVQERLEADDVDHEIHEYVRGNSPARDLIEATHDFGADLLVIGTRRRSSTGKLLLGSNALEILHDADVPVLCVKPGT